MEWKWPRYISNSANVELMENNSFINFEANRKSCH